MENYEQLILASLKGNTPKEKYEQLQSLISKIVQIKTFFNGLKDTPDSAIIGDLRSIIDANYENINR